METSFSSHASSSDDLTICRVVVARRSSFAKNNEVLYSSSTYYEYKEYEYERLKISAVRPSYLYRRNRSIVDNVL